MLSLELQKLGVRAVKLAWATCTLGGCQYPIDTHSTSNLGFGLQGNLEVDRR